MFRYWYKELFLPGILCLGTGIKSYFCWDLVFRYWDKWLFLAGILFRYWNRWLFLPGILFRYCDKELILSEILCLDTEIKSYFCLGSCV